MSVIALAMMGTAMATTGTDSERIKRLPSPDTVNPTDNRLEKVVKTMIDQYKLGQTHQMLLEDIAKKQASLFYTNQETLDFLHQCIMPTYKKAEEAQDGKSPEFNWGTVPEPATS